MKKPKKPSCVIEFDGYMTKDFKCFNCGVQIPANTPHRCKKVDGRVVLSTMTVDVTNHRVKKT